MGELRTPDRDRPGLRRARRALVPAATLAAALLLALPAAAGAAPWGDVNGDGEANPADAFRLVDLLAAGQAPPDADFDGNGVTDGADATHLLRLLLETGVVGAATVGPAGGTVTAPDGFSVAVPAGALAEERRIEIERAPLPPGVQGASDRYLIHGLPEDFAGEITVTIPVDPPAAGAGLDRLRPSAIAPSALREYLGVPLAGVSYTRASTRTMVYLFEAAAGAVGTVVATIKGAGIAAADAYGIYSVGRLASLLTDNFEIMVTPEEWDAYQDTLILGEGVLLEVLHEELAAATGLAWSTIVPRHRVIFEANAGLEAEMVQSSLGNLGDFIVLDRALLTGGVSGVYLARPVIAHELMHLLQAQYDPRWSGLRRNLQDWWSSGGIYLWLHEAVATWAETRFAPTGPATPDVLAERAAAPFSGMQVNDPASQVTNQRHGYGMAGLVKYLADTYGDATVGEIYKKMRDYWFWYADGVHPIEAILAAASPGDPANLDWWYDFWVAWLQRSVYPGAPTAAAVRAFAEQQGLVIDLPAAGVRAAHPDRAFRQLSGTPYVVRVAGRVFAPGDALTVTYGGVVTKWDGNYACADRGIMVFKLPPAASAEPIMWLADDKRGVQATVPDLAGIASEGADLLVLILNRQHVSPYTGSNHGYVDLDVGNAARQLARDGVSWSISVTGLENLYPESHVATDPTFLLADFPALGTSGCLEVTATPDAAICSMSPSLTLSVAMFGTTRSTPVGGCGVASDSICGTLNGWTSGATEVSGTLLMSYGVGGTGTAGWSVAEAWENDRLCPW